MDGTNGLKETTRVTAPVASNTLGVNIFTAPGKAMVGERPKPFGEALGFDPITSTLIFGEHDAVLVDAMGTVASSSRRRYPSTARYAATSAILTATSSKSDRAPTSPTVDARPGTSVPQSRKSCHPSGNYLVVNSFREP